MALTKLVEFDSNGPIEFKDLEEILKHINKLSRDEEMNSGGSGSSALSQISEFGLNRAMTKLTVKFESDQDKDTMLEWAKVSCAGYNFLVYNPDAKPMVVPNGISSTVKAVETSAVTSRPRLLSHSQDAECVGGKFMAILNKLTESNFDKMVVQISALPISTESLLERVVDSFYKHVTLERSFIRLYVKLCKSMWLMKVPTDSNANQYTHFRHLFLMKCQSGFERGYMQDPDYLDLVEEAGSCENENRRKELVTKADEVLKSCKSRYLTNLILIGELYNIGFLTENIVFNCLQVLSKCESFDMFNWECLFTLLRSCGAALDTQKNQARLNSVFQNLEHLIAMAKSLGIPAKIRFMIMDIVDLRKNRWNTRAELRASQVN